MMRKYIRQFIQLILLSGISVVAHADRTRFCSVLCFAEDPQAQQSYLAQISERYFNKTLQNPAFYRKDHLENFFFNQFFSGAGNHAHDESMRYFQWEGSKCNYACPGDSHYVDSQKILMAVYGNRQRMRAFEIWMHSYGYFLDEASSSKINTPSWDSLAICALQRELAAKGYTLHADFDMPACLPFLAAKRPLRLPRQRYHPPHIHFLTISNGAGESLHIRVHKDLRQSYRCTPYQAKPSEDCNISYHPHDHYLFAREFRIPIGLVVISGEYH